jgi:hypothetical protein
MAWIELHQTLPRHPKLARLANRLRIPRAQAAGHLTFLWLWALDYCPTGDLSALEPAEISAAADFGGDAELFAKSLKEAGWIDEDGCIHDWHEYAGRLVDERVQSKERMRAYRERKRTAQMGAPPVTPNVRVTSGERAELPYSTQPNQAALHTQRARETFPTLDEVQAEAQLRCVPPEVAEAFWNHFESSGWVDRHGNPIQSWRPKLRKWWTDEQQRQAQERQQRRAPAGERREIQESVQPRIL